MTEQHEEFSDGESEPIVDEVAQASGSRRLYSWLRSLFIVIVVLLVVRVAGDELYDPPSRLPQSLTFTRGQDLLGATESVLAELRLTERSFPEGQPLDLKLEGEVHKVVFRRSLGDRLFGEHREHAVVFTASTTGNEYRFLILGDEKTQIYAIESARPRLRDGGPSGLFIVLPAQPPFQQLTAALAILRDEVEGGEAVEHSSEDFTVFGPFARGDRKAIQRQASDNVVLSHLIESLVGNRADVSLAAPLFLISRSPDDRIIRALYQPRFGAILEPAWESSRKSTLVHELVHAYMHKVERGRNDKLAAAASYFEKAHPRLYGEVISDLYRQLGRRGRAEETLANIAGALAAGETRTVEVVAALRSERLAETAEPILRSDVALLVEFGLLPKCMDPEELGYQEANVTFAYFGLVRKKCA